LPSLSRGRGVRGEQGQILVLSAFVLVVIVFLVMLVTSAAQLHAAQAQTEKAAELAARSGAIALGDQLSGVSPHIADWDEFVQGLVDAGQGAAQDIATRNGADEAQVIFNSPWEIEVVATKHVHLFAGFVPEVTLTATATASALAREVPTS